MYLAPGSGAGTMVNSLVIVVSPVPLSIDVITQPDTYQMDLGEPSVMKHGKVYVNLYMKLASIYGSHPDTEQKSNQIISRHGESVQLEKITWHAKLNPNTGDIKELPYTVQLNYYTYRILNKIYLIHLLKIKATKF